MRFHFDTQIEKDNKGSQFATLKNKDKIIRSQFATLENNEKSLRFQKGTIDDKRGKHRKYLPYVFTEQGVSMLSAVLRSQVAVIVSIQIMDAFVETRKFISKNAGVFQRLDKETVYHFGASLKDAGKKWFAFSKLDIDAEDIIDRL